MTWSLEKWSIERIRLRRLKVLVTALDASADEAWDMLRMSREDDVAYMQAQQVYENTLQRIRELLT